MHSEALSLRNSFRIAKGSPKRETLRKSPVLDAPRQLQVHVKPNFSKYKQKCLNQAPQSPQAPASIQFSLEELRNESIEQLKERTYRDLKSQLQTEDHPSERENRNLQIFKTASQVLPRKANAAKSKKQCALRKRNAPQLLTFPHRMRAFLSGGTSTPSRTLLEQSSSSSQRKQPPPLAQPPKI